MRHFDLIIIGTGSGNSLIDERFDDMNVAIVERAKFGGTCLNVGCIPTKMLVYPADLAAAPAEARRLGVDLERHQVRWPEVRDRIFGRIDSIEAAGRHYRTYENANVTVYEGEATFVAKKLVAVHGKDGTREEITADKFVLAAGSRPIIPDIPGLRDAGFYTSDDIMRIEELPSRLVILGSGFIGAEFAHIFSSFGVDVVMIARTGTILRSEDHEISARFTEVADHKWDLRLHSEVRHVQRSDSTTTVHLDGPNGRESIDTDALLVAVGRTPNSDLLDSTAGGITLHSDGRVAVDEHQRTSVDGIWALGDLCSPHELKHVANHEARVVQHNLLHPDTPIKADHRYVPHAVFSSPQVASVGLTEQQAQERGVDYVSATQDYAGIAYGWAMEDESGFCKVLADPVTGRILGAHIIGAQASVLIQPLIQAMHFDLDASSMARGQYWIHPAMPELIENALLNLP